MKLKGTQLIIIAAASLYIFSLPMMAASTMSVEPTYTEVWQGNEFTVNITVDSAEDEVYAASYTLYFNNTLLNATSLEKGPFLSHDGNPSNIQYPPTEIDNSIGEIKYGEYRVGMVPGVSGYGVLTTITFEVIGDAGISQLNLGDSDGDLLYSADPYGPIPTTLNNGRVGIAQPSTPFLIIGYVFNEDESNCNDPAVSITNLNTGKEWTAETSETSNYCQLALVSCADVITDEILQFSTVSPDGHQSNVTEHTVTQGEVDAGGFEYNTTLEFRPGDVNGDGEINSADVAIVLQMAVRGEYSEVADVSRDGAVTSLDALMILHLVGDL